MSDEKQLEDKVMEAVQQDEQLIRAVTQNIYMAAKKIADAGSQDVASVAQWTNIQGEIRKGINVIIAAYRRYIQLHQETCNLIGNFANSIITKYESEISAIDQLTPPISPRGV